MAGSRVGWVSDGSKVKEETVWSSLCSHSTPWTSDEEVTSPPGASTFLSIKWTNKAAAQVQHQIAWSGPVPHNTRAVH